MSNKNGWFQGDLHFLGNLRLAWNTVHWTRKYSSAVNLLISPAENPYAECMVRCESRAREIGMIPLNMGKIDPKLPRVTTHLPCQGATTNHSDSAWIRLVGWPPVGQWAKVGCCKDIDPKNCYIMSLAVMHMAPLAASQKSNKDVPPGGFQLDPCGSQIWLVSNASWEGIGVSPIKSC